MDWSTIITTLIAALLPSGGVTAVFLIRGKRKELEITNLSKVIDELREITEGYKAEVAEYKKTLEHKEDIIEQLHREKSALYDKLDKANSRAAVNKLLKCQEIGCAQRRPPLGEGAADTFRQIREGNLGENY